MFFCAHLQSCCCLEPFGNNSRRGSEGIGLVPNSLGHFSCIMQDQWCSWEMLQLYLKRNWKSSWDDILSTTYNVWVKHVTYCILIQRLAPLKVFCWTDDLSGRLQNVEILQGISLYRLKIGTGAWNCRPRGFPQGKGIKTPSPKEILVAAKAPAGSSSDQCWHLCSKWTQDWACASSMFLQCYQA